MMRQYSVLLSIAIPTFNRSKYLDLCLSRLCPQIKKYENEIQLIVSDNCSSDATNEVIQKYINLGYRIYVIRNNDNIGPDRNIAQCFNISQGKYVLILGDDDFFLDGAIDIIISILRMENFGIVYMNSYGFRDNFLPKYHKQPDQLNFKICTNIQSFIKLVHYYFTFISGNIINKSLVDNDLSLEEFFSTNLIQLSWTFSALFNSVKNCYIQTPLIATKTDNSGGYGLFTVFGVNFNKILKKYLSKKQIDKDSFDIINNKLLLYFFPRYLIMHRAKRLKLHNNENPIKLLKPVFKKYMLFWIVILPIAHCFFPISILYQRSISFFSIIKRNILFRCLNI